MFPWGDPPTTAAYAVGETIYSGDHCAGRIVSMDAAADTMEVIWSDGDKPITYPIGAPYLRKAMPWE